MFIEFPSGISQGEMPPLWVIGAEGNGQLVNYRVNDNYMIVDRLFAAADSSSAPSTSKCPHRAHRWEAAVVTNEARESEGGPSRAGRPRRCGCGPVGRR